MRLSSRRGTVLIQVLMGAMICAYIITMILRFQMQSGLLGSNLVDNVAKDKQAEAAINTIRDAWGVAGGSCLSLASAGVSCTGAALGCACTCTKAGLPAVESSPGTGGYCSLKVSLP